MHLLPTLLLASSALFFVVAVVLYLNGHELLGLVFLVVAIGDAVVATIVRARQR